MKTFWMSKEMGLPLKELRNEFPQDSTREYIDTLIKEFGEEASGGIGIYKECFIDSEDIKRIKSKLFRNNLISNTKPRAFDLTHSWTSIIKSLIILLQDGDEEGKAAARDEIFKMAKVADMFSKGINEAANFITWAATNGWYRNGKKDEWYQIPRQSVNKTAIELFKMYSNIED